MVVEVPKTGEPKLVTISVVRGGRILVDFRKEDRADLLKAEIRLLGTVGTELNLDRDESGGHDRETPRLVAGTYTLVVEWPDGRKRTISVDLEDGEDTKVVLRSN